MAEVVTEFGDWLNGAPVIIIGDTGDFNNWIDGAPVVGQRKIQTQEADFTIITFDLW